MVRQHFFNARLRAIETCKDIAVNSNNGISGQVLASGDFAVEMSGSNSNVEVVTIKPNKVISWYPYLPLLFCGIYLLGFISFRFVRNIWTQTLTGL